MSAEVTSVAPACGRVQLRGQGGQQQVKAYISPCESASVMGVWGAVRKCGSAAWGKGEQPGHEGQQHGEAWGSLRVWETEGKHHEGAWSML